MNDHPSGEATLHKQRGKWMRFWWVNQGNTAYNRHSASDLWAPYRDPDNKRQAHWEAMDSMAIGDVVLHYANGLVLGVSRVSHPSHAIVRPPEFEVEGRAGDEGRRVFVEYQPFDLPVPVNRIPMHLRVDGRTPFRSGGGVRRGYVFSVDLSVFKAVLEAVNLVEVAGDAVQLVEEPDDDNRELVLVIDDTDGTAVVKYRKEQGALRKALTGTAHEAACGLCGKVYPVALLHAAHIKPRRHASEAERRNLANVMLACLAGCDALFEQGFLQVSDDGTITSPALPPSGSALAALIQPLLGTRAPAFTEHNRDMFHWKRERSTT